MNVYCFIPHHGQLLWKWKYIFIFTCLVSIILDRQQKHCSKLDLLNKSKAEIINVTLLLFKIVVAVKELNPFDLFIH